MNRQAASTYIIEAGNASGAVNIAVFDARSTPTSSKNQQPTEDVTFARARRMHVGAAPRRQKLSSLEKFGETWGAPPTGEIKIEGAFLGPDKGTDSLQPVNAAAS